MSEKDPRQPPADQLVPAVGAVIFASGEPVSPRELAATFRSVDVEQIEEAIAELERAYEGGAAGLRLERVAGGVRLTTRPEVGAWVRQFFRQRNRTRLSPPALETLAIVAYRQPVTAPEIQAIRGKDPGAALKGLLDKRMIRILGKKKVVGSPLLYGTSKHFLVHFGLDSLRDLPSIEDFEEFAGALEAAQASLFETSAEEPDAAPGDEGAPQAEAAVADAPPEGEPDAR